MTARPEPFEVLAKRRAAAQVLDSPELLVIEAQKGHDVSLQPRISGIRHVALLCLEPMVASLRHTQRYKHSED